MPYFVQFACEGGGGGGGGGEGGGVRVPARIEIRIRPAGYFFFLPFFLSSV